MQDQLNNTTSKSKTKCTQLENELNELKTEHSSLCKAVQFLRDNVRSSTSIGDGGAGVALDGEGIERIQDSIIELESKSKKLKQMVDELLDSDEAKHNTLDNLHRLMESIQQNIVTKDMLEKTLSDKVSTVSCQFYVYSGAREQFSLSYH